MTKVIAHRGANRVAPQNTMPAFKIAKEMGAHGFENDVHMTADGYIVVCHNYSIDETSDGSGLILEKTLEELRQYDFGSYYSPEFAGTKIATLDEFYELARGLDIINVEIKPPLDRKFDIVNGVIDMAKEAGVFDNLLISSFDKEVLLKAHEYEPACKTAFLYDPNSPDIKIIAEDPVAYAKNLHADALHPVLFMVDEELVENAHKNGMAVNPWTVNDPEAIDFFIGIGCDALISDVPDFALKKIMNED